MIELVSQAEYTFEPPAILNIYRLRRPEATQTTLRRIGDRFGLNVSIDRGTLTENARGIGYSVASSWELKFFRQSGGWQYRHAARWQADDGKSHLDVEDEQLSELAFDALQQYALPVAPEIELLRVQRLHVAHCQRDGAHHQERVVGARVICRRVLDGIPVEGFGGRTTVYLNHERELTGIDYLWRDIEAVYEQVTQLRPVAAALAEVRRRYGSGDGRIEILDIRLGYFERGWDDQQEYLQPAYVVSARLVSPDARVRMNAVVPVAAAMNAVGPIEPPLPPRTPQPLRRQ
jgi:hypothetical protein